MTKELPEELDRRPMPISQHVLRSSPRSAAKARSVDEARALHIRTAFLSHSHLDRDLALGLISLLSQQGLELYVDWTDPEMPSTPDRKTAEQIRERIRHSQLFMFLATANSTRSRWCPWEIGVADIAKGPDGIIIIPTSEALGPWYGSEYLQLYKCIDETKQGGIALFEAGASAGGKPVRRLNSRGT